MEILDSRLHGNDKKRRIASGDTWFSFSLLSRGWEWQKKEGLIDEILDSHLHGNDRKGCIYGNDIIEILDSCFHGNDKKGRNDE